MRIVGRDPTPDELRDSSGRWRLLIFLLVSFLAILACGGSSSELMGEEAPDPVNQEIDGLPIFIAPSSTPLPTYTQPPTAIQPTVYSTPGGYATNTPYPGYSQECEWVVDPDTGLYEWVCSGPYVTNTPYPGGVYTTPGAVSPGATSTPRLTYTPFPSATPCLSSFVYYFGEEVFTDPSSENLTLGIALGNVRVIPSSLRPDQQIVGWTVEIRNLGYVDYLLFAPFQIYVAGINGNLVGEFSSDEAAREAGVDLDEPASNGYWINADESVRFDMFAYTSAPGDITALAYILDPYGNTYDGTIAGGNVAYWESGDRGMCGGRIGDDFTPVPNLTPKPTATPTNTPYFQG